ncbi:MAG: M12 family metallo-peptidase, partial [Phycisphaerales bacterium]|nr:M12 family metallo-peptidase [Phycisphaerales bacterium]
MLRIVRLVIFGLLTPILLAATSSPIDVVHKATLSAASSTTLHANTASDFQAEVNDVIGLLDSDVQRLHLVNLDDGQYELTVQIGDQQRRIRYAEHSNRTDSYQLLSQAPDGTLVEIPAGPINTYRGTDVSWPGMKSAMSIEDDGFRARFLGEDGEQWWIEPLGDRVRGANNDDYVVYRGEDVISPEGFCGVTDKHVVSLVTPEAPMPAGADRVVLAAEFVVDTDYEYFQNYGSESSVENRVNSVVNSFNLQYESQAEIVNELQAVVVRSDSNDPYSSNSIETRLEQVRSIWNSTNNPPHDIVQLFSGVSFTGSTIGLAWLGAVCSTFEYSVVESDCCGAFACATDLSAHELGHNWGAGHCSCPGNTMNPSITCANDFANSTIGSITSYRNSILGCLSDVYNGVCCLQEQCFDSVDESACINTGGIWNANQSCSQVDCSIPDPTGACCTNGNCTILTEAECGGTYLGDDSNCSGNPCGGGSGDDAFLGLSYSVVGSNLVDDSESTWTVDVYAHLADDCRLDAVAGDANQDKMISTTGSFYQNTFGGATSQAINPALFSTFPDLRYDSFVTIG